ncbi:thioesterase II family protein [Streptomyces sp. NPDC018045]|uniref:thioesterase II family protein n=1 Tax=Streptomyces sp. NPDC018045 TaxID=3365037 RepID=UPI00379CE532
MRNKSSGMIFDSAGITVNPDARALTLVLFHHAGGSALSLVPLVIDLPEHIRARIIELPGRGIRSTERPAEDFDRALHDCLENTSEYTAGPHILFGHSLGGAFAHEVGLSNESAGRARPRRVVLSSCSLRAGTRPPASGAPTRRDRSELTEEMQRHGGTPAEVFRSPHLLDAALATLGDDMILVDSYRPRPVLSRRNVPYSLWYGDSDETVVRDTAEVWAERTGAPTADVAVFPGGHFYLDQSTRPGQLLRDLARTEAAIPYEHA